MVLPEDVQRQAVTQGAVCYATPAGETYLVVHQAGTYAVFVNRCPHRRLPLDSGGRVLFTVDRQWLVCANHGARFHPLTGACIAGPCVGKQLQRVAVCASD
jgi:nitrite reductase/ring-hydroxylating ferredoxin subunit